MPQDSNASENSQNIKREYGTRLAGTILLKQIMANNAKYRNDNL